MRTLEFGNRSVFEFDFFDTLKDETVVLKYKL